MADDLGNCGPEDGKRISLVQGHEVRYWCDRLGCSEVELRAAVEAVGHMVADVEKFLDGGDMNSGG